MVRIIMVALGLSVFSGCQAVSFIRHGGHIPDPTEPRVVYPSVPRTTFTGPGALAQQRT